MARTYYAPPQYIQTLQRGNQPGQANVGNTYDYRNGSGGRTIAGPDSADTQGAYQNAVRQHYDAGNGATLGNGYAYDPSQAALYSDATQRQYQGGRAVSSRDLGQAASDQAQRQNLAQVGAQRGAGGQAQGLRAAMMGTTGAATAQNQAGMQANQEQVAQRQQILQQQLAQDQQQAEAKQAHTDEMNRFKKEKAEADADTQSGMAQMVGTFSGMNMMSDERAKVRKDGGKKRKAPKLIIMLHGGKY